MRLSLLVFCFLGAAAFAHKVALKEGWVVEFTTAEGQFTRDGFYDTRKACETAIPTILKEQSGYNGRCVHVNPKTGEIEGSQDPAQSNH
jgi:hypothetical protein